MFYHPSHPLYQSIPKGSLGVIYGKCPKISYTKVSDKVAYANSADPYQTDQGLHCLPFP